jgi:hypothetical protein
MSQVNNPQFILSQPTPTTIAMAAVAVRFGRSAPVHYGARTFNIPAPIEPTFYYVTIKESTLTPSCLTTDMLCGEAGHVYLGAIQVIPEGNSKVLIPGGWPAPQSFLVVD